MKKNLINIAIASLIFLFILPITIDAQEVWDYNGTAIVNPDAAAYSFYCDHGRSNDSPMNSYSSMDYHYDYRSNKRLRSSIHSGRKFDNSDNFSSGISSYQGTSTGPGPNGGYPGSPRGIYETYYFDNSIYPNSYMRINSR